ncbi:MAG: hypothetical protein ACR2RD_18635 [Woeseiaceae bacterium]
MVMATAEHLLHEAQYAFHSISYGQSRENRRNAARAKSLCMKILRKYPTGMEADEAHAILRRLGEEAYSSKMAVRHRPISQAAHHQSPPMARPSGQAIASTNEVEALNWSGLVASIFMMPKIALAMIVFAVIFLFGFLGPFLFVPLLAFVLFSGPFRNKLKPEQRKALNEFVVRVNDYLEKRQS